MEETPIDSEPTLLTPYNIPSDTSSRSSESNLLDEDNSGKDTDTVISGYIYIYIYRYIALYCVTFTVGLLFVVLSNGKS